jgi:predicted nucleic acid-binding protein
MTRRILDTAVLISHYNKMTILKSADTVKAHARLLINLQRTNWILSPVKIEFLCGSRDRAEFKLYSAYLEPFDVLDRRSIPPLDWREAERRAQWIKQDGSRRKLGDCLILAIAERLHAEVITNDRHFRRRIPPKLS